MKSSIYKALLVLLLGIMPYVGYAGGLGVMSYQGHLVDAANQPINGTINITFSIPGTAWTETYTNVQVNKGLFGVILGSQTPLTGVDWSQQNSLKIDYNGTSQTVPITGSPPLGDTLGNLNCTTDQIAKYNGTVWECLSLSSLPSKTGRFFAVPLAQVRAHNPFCNASTMSELVCVSGCSRWCQSRGYSSGTVVEWDGASLGCACIP
ncbi:secreted protein [Beggiatoa sp. PS]|nr:secreted protein [Beggiatoa sp. PS]